MAFPVYWVFLSNFSVASLSRNSDATIFLDLLFTSCLFLDTLTAILWDLACMFLVAMISGSVMAMCSAFCFHSKLLRLVPGPALVTIVVQMFS